MSEIEKSMCDNKPIEELMTNNTVNIATNIIDNIGETFDNVYNFIMMMVKEFETMIDSIELPDYFKNKPNSEYAQNNNTNGKSLGEFYDVYYDFLVKERDKSFTEFTIGEYEYSGSFTIIHRRFTMKLTLNDGKMLSSLIINGKTIENPFYDYVNGCKQHNDFESVHRELLNIRDNFQW